MAKASIHLSRSTLRPVGDRILIEHVDDKKEQTRGGVIIPESAREKPQAATVIALGSGRKTKDGAVTPFEVKVGDRILVAPYGGAEVKLDDRKYKLVREDDILGVLA